MRRTIINMIVGAAIALIVDTLMFHFPKLVDDVTRTRPAAPANFTREQMRQAFDCGYITGIEGPPFRESKKQCAPVMGSIGGFYGDSFK